jgi:hypothetical protein
MLDSGGVNLHSDGSSFTFSVVRGLGTQVLKHQTDQDLDTDFAGMSLDSDHIASMISGRSGQIK